jgi:hypothetical protein
MTARRLERSANDGSRRATGGFVASVLLAMVVDRLLETLGRPVVVSGETVEVAVSIGIASTGLRC